MRKGALATADTRKPAASLQRPAYRSLARAVVSAIAAGEVGRGSFVTSARNRPEPDFLTI